MPRLFGTDGVRGIAGDELNEELASRLAFAASQQFFTKDGKVLVGKDTRLSGDMIESALASGFVSGGCDVVSVGVIPTPGLARLCKETGHFGAVISASHNPIEYNGIKFFSPQGVKLRDEEEDEIEARMSQKPNGHTKGTFTKNIDLCERYCQDIASFFNLDLGGRKIVLDCAYGATYAVAPKLFKMFGADVIAINAEPDGSRINVDCGSTMPHMMCKTVLEQKAEMGFAFDGDGDRCIACDSQGRIVDGDKMMGILAKYMVKKNRLPGMAIVTTVMTNLGLEEHLSSCGIKMERTKVGDRYVHQRMTEKSLNLGGEQSGHIIIADRTTTGDGTLSAISLVEALEETGASLSDELDLIPEYPQILLNVKVRDREEAMNSPLVAELTQKAQEKLGKHGRILIRSSGTEALIRIMVEAVDEALCKEIAFDTTEKIKSRYGV